MMSESELRIIQVNERIITQLNKLAEDLKVTNLKIRSKYQFKKPTEQQEVYNSGRA